MPKMIAIKPMGRLRPGDEFEVRRSTEARVLTAIGKAKEAPPPAPEPPRRASRAQAEPAAVEPTAKPEPEQPEPEHPAQPTSRFYRRRDMTSDD